MRREEEIDLVRKAKEGDTVAFTEIVRRYQNLVYATALQILKDPALSEDAAQEAFVAAFRSLPDLRTESSFPPWLRKITRNLALALRKEQRRFGALEEAGVLQSPPADAGPEAEREWREADAFGVDVNVHGQQEKEADSPARERFQREGARSPSIGAPSTPIQELHLKSVNHI